MADFINTIDVLGDDAVYDSIIKRTITEFKDDRITSVRDYAFSNCVNLTKVDIPSATTVKYNSFNGCTTLAEVNIPAVTRIEAYNAFSGCKALKEIVLPSCSYIGQGAFSFCSKLEMADCAVTDSLYLGNNAFGSTTALKTLVIRSNSVATMASKNTLQESGIYYSRGYIYVPSALLSDDDATKDYRRATNWSDYANRFRKLEEWTVDGTVTGDLNIEGRHMVRFFDEDGTLLYYTIVNSGDDAVFVGDEPVKEGDYAFTGFVPDGTNITGDTDCYAQFRSTLLKYATLVKRTITEYSSETLSSVGEKAFSYCTALTRVDLSNVKTIGGQAFTHCSALTALILRTPSMCSLGNNVCFGSSLIEKGSGYIYVPKSLVDSYKNTRYWQTVANQIRAIEDYPDVCG